MNILVSFLVGDSSVTIRATEIIASSDKKTIYIYENPLDWFKDILSYDEFIEEKTDTIEFMNPISIDIDKDSISDVESISLNGILNTITINSNIFLESQKVYQVKGDIQFLHEYKRRFTDYYEPGDILVLTSYLINKN